MPFLAGDDDETCARYSVEIPGDDLSVLAFSGALAELAKAYNWEELGTWTATGLAEVFRVALDNAEWTVCENGEEYEMAIAVIADQKTLGTEGGTFTSGAWRVRDLNTELSDPDDIVSVADNKFTLPAGTYFLFASAPAFKTQQHQVRLYNDTASEEIAVGSSEIAAAAYAAQTRSWVAKVITLTVETDIELQHECNTTWALRGFGIEGDFNVEIYALVIIVKVE